MATFELTLYQWMQLADRVTGLVAAFLLFALVLGYLRVFDAESPLVRDIARSTGILLIASAIECLRVRETGSAEVQALGVVFNIAVLYAAYRGLHAQHRMIAEDERDQWHWYSAPLYPPWGFIAGLMRFGRRVRTHLYGKSDKPDRRKRRQPIDFPDRRRDRDEETEPKP